MKKELELYIHIPFCVRKCFYCDFLSAPSDEETRQRYLDALLAELSGRSRDCTAYEVVSIFIGGGTPSLLYGEQIARIMQSVKAHYTVREDAEITIEVNPGTVDGEKLRTYRAAGINRLSIGLQSADDKELRAIGRIHDWKQFAETYEAARFAGFDNINIDVMSTLPGQSLTSYRETLTKVTSLNPAPTHISAYSLILEEGTPLYERVQRGESAVPDEELDREMYALTERFLKERGYRRYEISNYAKEGFRCRHNCGYWTGTEYLGFGIGAASLFGGKRFRNGEELGGYLKAPLKLREDEMVLSPEERMEEFMFLGLRMTDGIDTGRFTELFGKTVTEVFGDAIRKNLEDGLLEYSEDGTRLFLTGRGLDLSNYVSAQFLLT